MDFQCVLSSSEIAYFQAALSGNLCLLLPESTREIISSRLSSVGLLEGEKLSELGEEIRQLQSADTPLFWLHSITSMQHVTYKLVSKNSLAYAVYSEGDDESRISLLPFGRATQEVAALTARPTLVLGSADSIIVQRELIGAIEAVDVDSIRHAVRGLIVDRIGAGLADVEWRLDLMFVSDMTKLEVEQLSILAFLSIGEELYRMAYHENSELPDFVPEAPFSAWSRVASFLSRVDG
ncbi:hypothetical protein ABYF32_07520 [Buchananella felis]|uniref:hypothetical protein n=1 Tax=Buchananella felis TaxID=3231492 RepID=UPI00352749D7